MMMGAAATTKKRAGAPIELHWCDILPLSSPVHGDVCFASPSPSPSPSATAKGKGKRKEEEEEEEEEEQEQEEGWAAEEIKGMRSEKLLRELRALRRAHPRFDGLLEDRAERERRGCLRRRLQPLLEAEARRRGIDTDKDGDDRSKRDARSDVKSVFAFKNDDKEADYAARKYHLKSSPIHSTKKNYGQLGVTVRRSARQAGRRRTIPVDDMYSSKSSSTALYGQKQRVHAIDPEEEDGEIYWQTEHNNSSNSTKRRKGQHEDSSPLYLQKVQDVVLLDDEDVQPDEPVDCGVPDKWNESKIYYPSRDDPEAVELSSSDIKCLDPGVYLSSPVINYYIQYIKRAKLHNEDCRDKFHMFNTYFYSKLQEALSGKGEFSKLRRWWKGVNIFQRGYIILPIHGTAHWSLIIICIPAKESNSGPIILHLDSLGLHPSAEIFDTVGRYLEAEWCHLRKNPPSDISMSETIWEDLPRNIHKEKVQVPRQNNEYDCGIFMLYYIERFIRDAPERFTKDKLDMFSRSWFKSEDASDLRKRIRELLLEEFESARVDDAMSEAATSDDSDEEDSIKEGDSEVVTPCGSSEMVVGGGDTDISNDGITEVGALEETPSSTRRSDDRIRDSVLSEAATLSDSIKDDEDTTKSDPDSSKTEQEIQILPSDRSKNNVAVIQRAPAPDICCDSSDSDMEDVKIIEVRNQRTNWRTCSII